MKRHKKKNAQAIFFKNALTTNILIFFVVLITVIGVLINNTYDVIKDAKLEVLEQQADQTKLFSNTIKYLTEDIYSYWKSQNYSFSTDDYSDFETIASGVLSDKSDLLNHMELYPSLIFMMKDGYTFFNGTITENDIKEIQSSFWYIHNMTNTKENLWTTKYNLIGNKIMMGITYGKSIIDENNNYQGIILVNIITDFLGNKSKALTENSTVRYILDENGYAVGHSISTLLGTGIYYMPYFWERFEPNSSKLFRKNSKMVLHTNYYDTVTGWTIVEEQDLAVLLGEFSDIVVVGIILLLFAIIFSIIATYLLARKISRPIVIMANQMIASKEGKIDTIDQQEDYKEVSVLSNIYNLTVEKMNHLIIKNKEEEKKKRQMELSFLQAQINPHFMHNTMFSIKCLIEMKKYDKANIMLTNLIKMLKMPINVSKEWITIRDEIEYLESYITLMKTRYEEREIIFEVNISMSAKNLYIPRLMLQPIIENSIFHGFDDNSSKVALISLEANIIGEKLIIRIRDNGKGMNKAEIDNLWNNSKKNSDNFNRIGLANIKKRINLLYGASYGMVVLSNEGEGTETILTLKCITEEDIGE